MVFQSNFTDYLVTLLSGKTYTVEFGDSTSVDYEDNDLDNTYFTKSTDITATTQSPMLKYSFTMEDTEGNGNTYNALMLNTDSNETNKILFNDIDKDSDIALEISFNIVFYPN